MQSKDDIMMAYSNWVDPQDLIQYLEDIIEEEMVDLRDFCILEKQ